MNRSKEYPEHERTPSKPAHADGNRDQQASETQIHVYQAGSTLREALDRFESVLENTPHVAIQGFDREGVIQHWNPACTTLYGYSRQEAMGQRLQDLLLEGEEKEIFKQVLDTIWRTGRASPLQEWKVIAKNGEPHWVYSTMFPIFEKQRVSEVFAMDVDITEQQRAVAALRQQEMENQAVISAIPDLVFLFDREGRYLRYHAPKEELLYAPPEKFLGRTVDEVLPQDVANAFHHHADRVLSTGKTQVFEYELEIHNEVKIFEARMVRYKADEALAVVRDISLRRYLETERLKAQRLESLGIMAGGIAHDFNNLLTAILGNISLLRFSGIASDKQVNECIDEAEKACMRAGLLTRQLLTFSRGGAPVREIISIEALVQSALEVSPRREGLQYDCAVPKNLWPVFADPIQMGQVLMNILVNAVEAMPDKGHIKIRAANIRLKDKSEVPLPPGRYIELCIDDEGVGIPEKNLVHIFDPFFSTKDTGHGLGLAICYSIVQKHGGHLRVRSREGDGTSMCVYLPAAKSEPENNRLKDEE